MSPLPSHCSGLMYVGVPMTRPVRVLCDEVPPSPVSLAMPKSSSLTKLRSAPRPTRKMFSGLRSRWTIPLACDAASAEQHCCMTCSVSLNGRPARRMRDESASPSRNSMMK